jgi:hypothetical protein
MRNVGHKPEDHDLEHIQIYFHLLQLRSYVTGKL